ncbi:MAG: CobW family GTP-binding protein [Bacillota bacterium]
MHVDVINGLLGAGKTTFLINMLKQISGDEKVAVLVNEFGEIGIDGDILYGRGADVVELPNGCICCTLTADLRKQIGVIAETYHPERLLIEPTGVATIKNLLGILRSLSLEKYIDDIRVILVLDAGMFREIFMQNRGFVETQIQMANVIILNKCDKATPGEVTQIVNVIRKINGPEEVLLTTYGQVSERLRLKPMLQPATVMAGDKVIHGCHHELPLKKYEQFGTVCKDTFNADKLREFFTHLRDSRYGDIDRAKGIFQIGDDHWIRLQLASKEIEEVPADRAIKASKIIIIGTQIDREKLKNALNNCIL